MAEGKKSIFEERSWKWAIVNFVALFIAAMLLWPLMELVFDALSGNPYDYDIMTNALRALGLAFVFTLIEYFTWDFWHKDTKSTKNEKKS